MTSSAYALVAGFAFGLAGCGEEVVDVSYRSDVAPVLAEHCTVCHQPGGGADFSLTTFDEVHPRAGAIAAAARNRTMPPIPAVADGSCRSFSDAKWLTEDEIATFERWANAGAPEGTGPTPEPPPSIEALGPEAVAFPMKSAFTPVPGPSGPDVYRCFVIGDGVPSDGYVTAAEFHPGAGDQVHHVLLFAVDPTFDQGGLTNAAGVAAMEADDPEPGWDCYTGVGLAVTPRAQLPGWFHGSAVTRLPADTGLRVRAGDWVLMQVHYRAGETPAPDTTSVRLDIAPSVGTPAVSVFKDPITFIGGGMPPSLSPGLENAHFTWELPASEFGAELTRQGLGDAPTFRLLGVAPHMHEIATGFDFDVAVGGEPSCALDIERWNFGWQRSYFYDAPIPIDAASTAFRVQCTYDTRGQTGPTFAAHDQGGEMCALVAYVAPASP